MKKTIFFCFVATLFIAGISSCSKTSTPNPNAQFLGTYVGAGTFTIAGGSPYAYNDTFIITATPSNSSGIIISGTSSNSYYLSATVSGNSYTLTPNQSYLNGLTISSGSGTLSGNSLSYNYIGITSGSAFALVATDTK